MEQMASSGLGQGTNVSNVISDGLRISIMSCELGALSIVG